MRKETKTLLFTVGMFLVTIVFTNLLWALLSYQVLPSTISSLLIGIGSYLWIILPVAIFSILKFKEKKGKLSQTEEALKYASVWYFVISVVIQVMGYVADLSIR